MKHFTRHPSKVTAATDILSFKCPGCKNKTLYSAEQDVHRAADVDENELFICDECGGEFRAHPQYNGSIKFTESIESATNADGEKIDRRLSPTSKRYKGYRISLDTRYECYNIYDAHGELEDHGFRSVEDAMAHIDELVSSEPSTDAQEIPEFNDWLYDKYGYGDTDLTDDDWEHYHAEYLEETGLDKYMQYMNGNVYSSKQPGIRRKSTHRPVTAAKKRIARVGEWDNGHVIRTDWRSMSPEDAEEEARKQSLKDPESTYYVAYDDVMNPCSPYSWKNGKKVESSTCASNRTRRERAVKSSSKADPADYEDDIQEISQEFTSENTSINSSKLPAIFKMVTFQPGTINIDYGGGRFDNVADYLTQFDVINLVYDPYNRTPEHNKDVIRTVRKAGGADTATCSNVLNVIKEPEVRQNVLQNIKKLVKPNGTVYITVYEGSGKGNEGPTKSGYQLNRKTEGYLDEIKQVFPDAVRKGKLIVAHPNGSAVTSAEDLSYDALTFEDCTYDLWTLVQDDNGKWVREDRIGTYDTMDEARKVASNALMDIDCQIIEVGGPQGLEVVWSSLDDQITSNESLPSRYWEPEDDRTDEEKYQDWLDKGAVPNYDDEDILLSGSIKAASSQDFLDIETNLRSNSKIKMSSGSWKVDTIYLMYDPTVDDAPHLVGYAHDNDGNYDRDALTADEIVNCDLSAYMDGIDVVDVEGMINDNPKYFYTKFNDGPIKFDEDVEGASISSASGRKHSIKTLHDALLNRASQVMRMNGFPLNEIADYLVVDIQPAEDGWLNCEVRAELSYEGMSDMIDALNPIVQKYDKDAYFDNVTGGIISAYLPSGKFNAIQSATDTNSSKVFELVQYTPDSGENGPAGDDFDVVDWGEFESEEAAKAHWSAEIQDGTHFVREGNPSDYIEEATVLGAWGVDDYPEPPEGDEPEERNSREEIIIDLDDDIVVEDNGDSVEFLRDPAFLEDEDEWTPEDEPMFQIDDGDRVYEHVMDLIIDSIPAVDGKYHIKGRVKLVYDVTLSYYYEGTSEEDETTELNKDGCSSDYDNYRSEVIELDVTEI